MEAVGLPPTILVVDDAPENLMVMEAILGDAYTLKLFEDARSAIDFANAYPPDLILLDIMMPDIDGFEACRELKSKLSHVPVIFITAKTSVTDEECGFAAGAADFIQKPVSAPVVRARVSTHLKIKFLLDHLQTQEADLTKIRAQLAIIKTGLLS